MGALVKKLKMESKVWFDAKGYSCIWINGKSKKCHVLAWESVNGPKPKGFDIHHKDEDKSNFDLENLELLTHSDHRKVHAGWIRENGLWIKKPCTGCLIVLAVDDFYPRKNLTPSPLCKHCHAIKSTEWKTKNKEKRKVIALRYYYKNHEENKHKGKVRAVTRRAVSKEVSV